MTVAYALGKTLGEIEHMPVDELAYWLAFLSLKQKDAQRQSR